MIFALALTSAVMKVVVLCKLENLVTDYTVSLPFAYRRTNDAVLYILENTYSHLEKTGGSARLMFFDFFSFSHGSLITLQIDFSMYG